MAHDQSSGGSDANADSREMGVDLGELKADLEALDYPVTREVVLDAHGDAEIETSGGTETLQSILGGQELSTDDSDPHEYDSADAVQQSILNMIGSEAVGREDYSDRGGAAGSAGESDTEGEDGEDESL